MLLSTRKLMKRVELRPGLPLRAISRQAGMQDAPASDRTQALNPGVAIARELISSNPAEFAVARQRANGE